MDHKKMEGAGMRDTPFLIACMLAVVWSRAHGASNLVVNGSFDHPDDPLYGWRYKYDREGESWYFNNHEHVKVVEEFAGRKKVLALWGDYAILQVPGQGTKVDSLPIPVEKGARYRLTVTARTTGPSSRILAEGYQWRPGIKPHPNPEWHELRKCYKSELIYFGKDEGGTMSSPSRSNWETASVLFPPASPTPLAKNILAKMEFVVIHIIAIGGSEGTLYVDEVRLEKVSDPKP
jgi:hypothetical protein